MLTSWGPAKAKTKQPLSCALAALMHSKAKALATVSLGPRMDPGQTNTEYVYNVCKVLLECWLSHGHCRHKNETIQALPSKFH